MKKLLFIISVLVSGVAMAQTPTGYSPINSKYNLVGGLFRQVLHVPSGGNPTLGTGGYFGSGALYYDSTGADSGLYYFRNPLWHKIARVDDVPNLFTFQNGIVQTGSVVGLGGSLVNGTTINANKNAFAMDSLNSFLLRGRGVLGAYGTRTHLFQMSPLGGSQIRLRVETSLNGASFSQFSMSNLNEYRPFSTWTVVDSTNSSTSILLRVDSLEFQLDGSGGQPKRWIFNGMPTTETVTDTSIFKPVVMDGQNIYKMDFWPTLGGGGGGITDLNGLTGDPQTFATGTTGTDFGISSVGTTHTFNIPDASSSNRGLVTTGTQTFLGLKTFTNDLTVTGDGNIVGLDLKFNGRTVISESESGSLTRYKGLNGTNQFFNSGSNSSIHVYTGSGSQSVQLNAFSSTSAQLQTAGQNNLNIQPGTDLKTGFHVLSPTARVDIAAGTSALAALGLNSGVDLSSPLAGKFYYNGTRLAFSPSTTIKRILLSNDVAPSNGQIPIGNGTDLTMATITAGTGVTVTNGSGTITIASTDGFIEATTTTTDATPTTIATVSPTLGESGTVKVILSGIRNNGDEFIAGEKMVRYMRTSGGTLTLGTVLDILTTEETITGSPTWTITTSGSTVVPQVTGVAATTIIWNVKYVVTKSNAPL
jgi:hypothetical protein